MEIVGFEPLALWLSVKFHGLIRVEEPNSNKILFLFSILEAINAQQVIDAYHKLFQVEKSFRMSKSDLKARPIFHHKRDSIEAHLTIVFTALAVARYIERATGVSISKFVKMLKPIRNGIISINGALYPVKPKIPDHIQKLLSSLKWNVVTNLVKSGDEIHRSNFGQGEMKSNSIGSKHSRRAKILTELLVLLFLITSLKNIIFK